MNDELADRSVTLAVIHSAHWRPLDANGFELEAWTLAIGPYKAHINLVGGSGYYGTVRTTPADTRAVGGPFTSAEDTRRWCENTLNDLASTERHLAR